MYVSEAEVEERRKMQLEDASIYGVYIYIGKIYI